ncbi:MAG: 16S rRNA (guanine(966)-N(2))-methyltransferase RsmD [Pseudomonadota bacterium]
MRITGGKCKGFALASPKNDLIRPTADRVRESLFNILSHRPELSLDDAVVLDLFCGAGTLGLEALSRGAAFCIFTDNSKASLQLARQNTTKLKLLDQARFLKHNAAASWPDSYLPADKISLVFVDPPYAKDLAVTGITRLKQAGILADNAVIVVEMSAKHPEEETIPGFNLFDARKYGDTILRLYQAAAETA